MKLSPNKLIEIIGQNAEKFREVVASSNSTADLCKLYNTHDNGDARQAFNSLLAKYNITTSHWHIRPRKYPLVEKVCPVCKEVFKTGLGEPREKITCSHRCSSFYFKRHTPESRAKISSTLITRYENKPRKSFGPSRAKYPVIVHTCPVCNKVFESRRKVQTYCSKQCVVKDPAYIEKLKQVQRQRVANGTHTGWSSRNKPSYAERFFFKVLSNNKVPYEFEKKVGPYFIDFAIEGKYIALEIDGKQHKYPDRVTSDQKKDKYLKEQGWYVYRIPWVSLNNKEGKDKMRNQIQEFLRYYQQ